MIRAAVRRPRGLLLPQGAGPAGCTPFSFPSCGKENGPCTAQREKRLARSGAVALRATGVGGSVQAPIWAGLRTRLALLRFLWLLSRARTADLIGVVVALRCFSFR